MLCPQILADVLSQAIVSRGSIVATIQMIVQQEMNGTDVFHLKPVNQLSIVLRTEELLDLSNREE